MLPDIQPITPATERAGGARAAGQPAVVLHRLGLCHYRPVWRRMQEFTRRRAPETEDQIWLLQHHPVFTRGTGCRALPGPLPVGVRGEIPLVHSDRGGSITYHGPGQLIAYLLLDLRRRGHGPKSLVRRIEEVVLGLLADYAVTAARRPGAPGVYVDGAKIAALGLRITGGCCFHGLSLNVDMDLRPYQAIDPCGYRGLAVTQLRDHAAGVKIGEVEGRLARRLTTEFGQSD